MMGRLELLNDIVHDKSSNINFPRVQNKVNKSSVHDLPTNVELFAALEGAKVLALSDAAMLDMIVDEKELTCGIANMKQSKQSTENDMEDDISDIFEGDEDNEILLDQPVQNGDTDSSLLEVEAESELTRLSSAPSNTRIDQRFVDVLNNDGSTKSLLKSTVIWALTESKGYLSKDRLKRVQSRIAAETPVREAVKENWIKLIL